MKGEAEIDAGYLRERLVNGYSVYVDKLYKLSEYSPAYYDAKEKLEKAQNTKCAKLKEDTQKLKDAVMLGNDEDALKMLNEYIAIEY